jgi:helix-turn-helix protein
MDGVRFEVPDLLTERSLAELLGISRESAMALCRANRVPARKIMRGRYLVSKRVLVDWVEKGSRR